MTYKLPPLPPQSSKVFRTAIGPVEVLAYTAEQMQAYAIAAIEAQGVPEIDYEALITDGAEPAPAGSGGWEAHAKALEQELAHWKQRAQTMHEHQKGECWYWQGNDHPESMANSLPVVIRADALRALMAPQASVVQQEPVAGQCRFVDPARNVIEAAKAAGWPQTAIDMASKQEIDRLERFAKIITNQALEEAAVLCDDLRSPWGYSAEKADWIRGTDDCAHAIRSMK